jgi:hypothetical protein
MKRPDIPKEFGVMENLDFQARPKPRELPVTNHTCAIHPPIQIATTSNQILGILGVEGPRKSLQGQISHSPSA